MSSVDRLPRIVPGPLRRSVSRFREEARDPRKGMLTDVAGLSRAGAARPAVCTRKPLDTVALSLCHASSQTNVVHFVPVKHNTTVSDQRDVFDNNVVFLFCVVASITDDKVFIHDANREFLRRKK